MPVRSSRMACHAATSPIFAVVDNTCRYALLLPLFLACAGALHAQQFDPEIYPLIEDENGFPFGVASGDPRQDCVLLWTKFLPDDLGETVQLQWEIATDTLLTDVVAQGVVSTDSSSAFTAMVEPSGLAPGSTYFYRFRSVDRQIESPIGRTRTAPDDPSALKFAVVSCSIHNERYFNGYALIAARSDIDAVIHLGDYIYEQAGKRDIDRRHIPPHDIVSLRDYRSRYAQYRLDHDLAELHRLHPMIAIWDDHEFANDAYRDGAKQHRKDQGDWETRKSIAKQVWFEWLPTKTHREQTIIRDFSYGKLADLFMIDGRLERDTIVADFNDPARVDPERTKLGEEQTAALTTWLRDSEAQWKVIGNNVMFVATNLSRFAKDRQWNTDAWDGFPANRAQIFDTLQTHDINNVVVLTGDVHMAWAFELVEHPHDRKKYRRRRGGQIHGAEFVVQSVTSSNVDEYSGRFFGKLANMFLASRKRNPHLRYVNAIDHGYMLLEITPEAATATWYYTKNPYKRNLKTKRPRQRSLHDNGRLLRRRP